MKNNVMILRLIPRMRVLILFMLIGWSFWASLSHASDRSFLSAKVCPGKSATEKLACNIHREALYILNSSLYGISSEHKISVPSLHTGPRYIERQIVASADALQAKGVIIPDLRAAYDKEVILSALHIVPTILSTPLYGYEKSNNHSFAPPKDTDDAIDRGVGICGNDAALFDALLTDLGIRTRVVQFWWQSDDGVSLNHIAIEAFWKGKWRLYDPTFDAYFVASHSDAVDPLSTKEAREEGFRAVLNKSNASYRYYRAANLDPFAHLERKAVDVTIDYEGTITTHLKESGKIFFTDFTGIPNFAGDNLEDDDSIGISFRFPQLKGNYQVTIDIAGIASCKSSVLKLGNHLVPLKVGSHVIENVREPGLLHVEGPDDVCYVVFNSIRFEPTLLREAAGQPSANRQ